MNQKQSVIRKIVLLCLLACGISLMSSGQQTNTFHGKMQKVKYRNGFAMEDYWVWYGSVIKGENGRYQMFASRWPKKFPFHPSWMVASEIVRAENI